MAKWHNNKSSFGEDKNGSVPHPGIDLYGWVCTHKCRHDTICFIIRCIIAKHTPNDIRQVRHSTCDNDETRNISPYDAPLISTTQKNETQSLTSTFHTTRPTCFSCIID